MNNSMKLIQSPASPFARKARIVIRETGLTSRVEEVNPGAVTPVSNNVSVNTMNPLGMIPALQLDDGSTLFDSTIICEYLNKVAGGSLYPADDDSYFKSRKLESLCDGILDLSVSLRYETALRPENLRWSEYVEFSNEKIERALDQLDAECENFSPTLTIGEITAACVLGYRDFRFGDINWRSSRTKLDKWFATMQQRESIIQTPTPAT